jgi:hypothetical protein
MKTIARISLILLGAARAFSQGCTMCYTAAAQQSEQGKHALDIGILMLLIPAIAMFCGLFFLIWRSKDAARVDDYEEAWRR